MAEITFSHVTKVYGGDAPAVRDLNLEIREGEFVVLVGPSGCGKTTALRMVAGLEEITAGEIRIGDRVVNELAPRDRDIAMVFQSYALYPHMTVQRNIESPLLVRKYHADGPDKPDRKLTKALDVAYQQVMLDDRDVDAAVAGGQAEMEAAFARYYG